METIELNRQQMTMIKMALDEMIEGKWDIGETNKKIIEQIQQKLLMAKYESK